MNRRKFMNILGSGIAAYATLGLNCSKQINQNKRPNFILFFADDLGYGDLNSYGHPNIRTPHLDRMANEGVRLTSFYATASVCTPSRVALLTGRYPVRTGQYNNLGPASKGGLSLDEVLLPQTLKSIGYKTMAIGKWHIGHDPVDYMPTSRGFDSYYGLLYSNDMIPPWVKTDVPLKLFRGTEPIETPVNQNTLTERYTQEAIKFIKSSKDDPFFIYIPHSMPHLPVRTSEKFRGKSRAGLYGDVIQTVDWSVEQVLQTLKDEGLDENTMVIFTSDNGPWLQLPPRMLQEGNERWHSGSKGLLRGSKGTTYEGGFRVPCIVRWPGHLPEGEIIEEMACTMDLFATIVETAGASFPENKFIDGINIFSLLNGDSTSPREEFFFFGSNRLEGIRQGPWKFRLSRHQDDLKWSETSEPELFNLDLDPSESYNVADRHPEIVKKLYNRMEEFALELKAKLEKM